MRVFFFFLNPSLLSFEAWPHVGLYIRLCYPLAPSASFASISVAILSFRAGLTPSDRSPHGTSTETLFSDAPSWDMRVFICVLRFIDMFGSVQMCHSDSFIWEQCGSIPDAKTDDHKSIVHSLLLVLC